MTGMTRPIPLYRSPLAGARTAARWAALAIGVAVCAVALLGFAAWLVLRPMAGEWNVDVPLGRGAHAPTWTVGAARALRTLTEPAIARRLDSTSFTQHRGVVTGRITLHWYDDTRTLFVLCAPCRLNHPSLARRSIELPSLELALRRTGEGALAGHVASRAVVLPFEGTLSRHGLALRGELAPTPVAALLSLFGDMVPEAATARIEGQASARWRLDLPAGRFAMQPVLGEIAVEGLGTDTLRHARLPAGCGDPDAPGSRWLERAVVAAEDARFFEHPGYDLAAMLAMHASDQRGGGSTLTQQLAKRLYTGDERTLARKLREWLYAVEMERTLGKPRILQLYLAVAPWAPGVCGAEAAARHHLGAALPALDPVQAAWLASLLPEPRVVPPRVDADRVAAIVEGLSGLGPQQRRRELARAAAWLPPTPAHAVE